MQTLFPRGPWCCPEAAGKTVCDRCSSLSLRHFLDGEKEAAVSDREKEDPWVPMSGPIDIKHIGKLIEELNECASAAARCLIQGMRSVEPDTKKVNKRWLEEEIADVMANIDLVQMRFQLDMPFIQERRTEKRRRLMIWHEQ